MKKLLIVCGLLFSVITFAQAQDGGRRGGTPEERVQRSVEGLSKKLNLNDDQKSKVTAIFQEQAVAISKAREGGAGGDRAARRAQLSKIAEDTDVKISALLNADQKKTFESWKAERKERMKNREKGEGPKGGGDQ